MAKLKTTWYHIRRSPYQALAAILVMFLTLFATSVFLILGFASQKILTYFESKPQVTVFLKEGTKKEEVDNIIEKLKETEKTSEIKYVSKNEALAIYREQNKNDPLLLEMVTANILPESIEVSAKDIKDLSGISEFLQNEPQAEEVVFQKDIIDTLMRWTNAIRTFGLGLIAFLTLVSVLVILMVIGMKISQRREEIETMRLVGASTWYIRWPFIVEGVMYGVLGGVFAWAVSYALLLYLTPVLSPFLSGISLFPISFVLMLYLLGILTASGIIVGSAGSFLAVWRYLK